MPASWLSGAYFGAVGSVVLAGALGSIMDHSFKKALLWFAASMAWVLLFAALGIAVAAICAPRAKANDNELG